MKIKFLKIIAGMMFITSMSFVVSPVNAQYLGGVNSQQRELGECIGLQGLCSEQHLVNRIEKEQNNTIVVLVVGIPFLVMIGFLVWRRK
ncbi:MAG: hypothetical protein K5798_09930 [Nitrosopumilus sp.]|uniref:hypothetical protein n=1 Tax=Nitrosopumilus sp. TaxID=2024843 RepID=UPI002430E885|nr:hypothetical protein [Nitrosopumilus sp.]MCV0367563.1 hypothetical protein [Nitrosopumilus sp.]